jgi:peptide/nickel transport system permease protein
MRRRRGLGPAGNVALIGLVALIGFIVVGPSLYPVSPTLVSAGTRLQPPSSEHPLGTDQLGREVLARVMAGGRACAWRR